jgi:hypothetical protein
VTDQRNPIESVLDVLVYLPVGVALTAAEEIPKLTAKGRATVSAQLSAARVVGQFAVAQGRREVERRWKQATDPVPAGPPGSPAPTGAPAPDRAGAAAATGGSPASPGGWPAVATGCSPAPPGGGPDAATGSPLASPASSPHLATPFPWPNEAAADPGANGPIAESDEDDTGYMPPSPGSGAFFAAGAHPTVEELAIPGYDSLSASQVVQRLAGLSAQELAAVGAYEATHRARRTVLTRVEQLQTG